MVRFITLGIVVAIAAAIMISASTADAAVATLSLTPSSASLNAGYSATFDIGVSVDGAGTSGVIQGQVWDDENGDGSRSVGEQGIYRWVFLQGSPINVSLDGSFVITDLAPGQYTLSVDPDDSSGSLCIDTTGSFSPLGRSSGCSPAVPILWEPTTPRQVDIAVSPGSTTVVDFGLRRRDITVVRGAALLGALKADNGEFVEAWANGLRCGWVQTAPQPQNIDFTIQVFGARERSGCAQDGETVTFTVGGVAATQTLVWDEYLATADLDLVAMPEHAWYWVQQPASSRDDGIGTVVQASVDGHVCGQARVTRALPGFSPDPGPIGLYELAVPSANLQPGCGYPGAVVTFTVGGTPSDFTAAWQAGVARIDLPIPGMILIGDVNCDGTIDAADALLDLRLAARLDDSPPAGCPHVGNVDCNGFVNAVDALHILRFAAGLPSTVPSGCKGVGG